MALSASEEVRENAIENPRVTLRASVRAADRVQPKFFVAGLSQRVTTTPSTATKNLIRYDALEPTAARRLRSDAPGIRSCSVRSNIPAGG